MAKLKLTKTELKHQNDQLKLFQQYLPTLDLRRKQLNQELLRYRSLLLEYETQLIKLEETFISDKWILNFLCDKDRIYYERLLDYFSISHTEVRYINLVGVMIPSLEKIHFQIQEYSLVDLPLWVDGFFSYFQSSLEKNLHILFIQRSIQILTEELLRATQRVNLFDKIKIPETKKNIHSIKINLDDEQVASVVRSKIAKTKLLLSTRGQ